MSAPFKSKLLAATRPEETARALAARHGPPEVRPSLRKDLAVRRQVQLGEVVWIVKDPRKMAYFQFKNPHWQLMRLFDGTRTRDEILHAYNERAAHPIDITVVLEHEESLRDMELIELSPAERSLTLLDKYRSMRQTTADYKSEGFNPFFIKFHVLDPDRFLNATVTYVRWIWTRPIAILTCIAAVWTVAVFAQDWQPIWSGTRDLYHFIGKPLVDVAHFFLILSIIGGIHEFSHAYACKVYGGEVHDIGLLLFYFTPAFYCNTSDSFMFPSRWQRLTVTLAGIYVEVIICSIATALWVLSYPDSFIHQFAYKTMLLTGASTIFFNVNPLVKADGYYALSSVLQLQDLRESAFRLITASFQKHVLRLPVQIPAMTQRKRRLCAIYGILSASYTAFIMLFIGKLFNNLYTRYFPDIASALLVVTLFYIFRKRLRKALRVGKLFYLDKRERLMAPRSRLPLAFGAAAVAVILCVPLARRTIAAETFLRPETEMKIQAPEDGIVTAVYTREGNTVRQGQPLFQITSAVVDAEARSQLAIRERFDKTASADRTASNALLAFQAGRRASAAQAAGDMLEYRREFLVVRSPIAGQVLTPRLDDLLGLSVSSGFPLALVGDCRRMVADAAVSERQLEYLRKGLPVSAFIAMRSLKPRKGVIVSISASTLEQPATASPGSTPGPPSSKPDRFVARALFENSGGELLPGALARLKIYSARESYASRALSSAWRWIRTIVW